MVLGGEAVSYERDTPVDTHLRAGDREQKDEDKSTLQQRSVCDRVPTSLDRLFPPNRFSHVPDFPDT